MTIEIELLGDDHKMAQSKPTHTYVRIEHYLTPVQMATLDKLKIPQVLWPTCTRQAQVLINRVIADRERELQLMREVLRLDGITDVPTSWEEAMEMYKQLMHARGLLHLLFEGHGIFTVNVKEMIAKKLHPAIIRRIVKQMKKDCNQSWSWIDMLGALSDIGSELDSNLVQSAYQFVVDEHDVMMQVQAHMELDAMIAQCAQEEEDMWYARRLDNGM